MSTDSDYPKSDDSWADAQVAAAAREAAGIGGRAGDEHLDPAMRPLIEAGEGVSEGFELAEEALIAAAEHRGPRADPLSDAFSVERERASGVAYGEADESRSSS